MIEITAEDVKRIFEDYHRVNGVECVTMNFAEIRAAIANYRGISFEDKELRKIIKGMRKEGWLRVKPLQIKGKLQGCGYSYVNKEEGAKVASVDTVQAEHDFGGKPA
jgi:hypothetical protein